MKYWLKKSCISLITIAVLATSLLAVDYPKDPPVTSGGEGPTGNDWTDFGVFSNNKLFWRDENDLNHVTSTYYIIIETANTNFVLANNRNTAGDKVKHTHYKDNYGDVSCPTVTDGNRYWDWFHEGYTPVTTRISNCSITKNCVSKAYHNYKGANTVSTNWTDPGNRTPFTGELELIFGYGDNGSADTQSGDRCDNSSHAWWITASPACSPATGLRWKNGSGREYSWAPTTATNDGLSGRGGFYGYYSIRNKDSR